MEKNSSKINVIAIIHRFSLSLSISLTLSLSPSLSLSQLSISTDFSSFWLRNLRKSLNFAPLNSAHFISHHSSHYPFIPSSVIRSSKYRWLFSRSGSLYLNRAAFLLPFFSSFVSFLFCGFFFFYFEFNVMIFFKKFILNKVNF